MVERAYKKIWCLKRLKKLGANTIDLVDVYVKQIRSILEFAVPVWHPSLTNEDRMKIERVQKSAFCIIMGQEYRSYRAALKHLRLETLFARINLSIIVNSLNGSSPTKRGSTPGICLQNFVKFIIEQKGSEEVPSVI